MAPALTVSGIVMEVLHILIHTLDKVERENVLMKNKEVRISHVRTTVKNKTELISQLSFDLQ